jgi:hypothetical protein
MRITVLLILLALLYGAPVVLAQRANTAAINGNVLDAQEAIISGASVTITHQETGQVRQVVTDASGYFQFLALPVGTYNVAVEMAGFRKFQTTGVQLQVGDNRKLDVRLVVGDVATSIQVEAAASEVETTNATMRDVVDSRRVVELPLNGRNLLELTMLVPGINPAQGVGGGAGDAGKQLVTAKWVSVNGSRDSNVRYTLDGGANNDVLYNLAMAFPFPDAVQEFSVQTSGQGVEIGKSSGGTVNIVTKSGTNEIHGNAFSFLRSSAVNANNFFSRAGDALKRNQTGFTLGGPLIKNKLFLFGGYQRTWTRKTTQTGKARTMPQAYRDGDFSALLKGSSPIYLRDPKASGTCSAGNQSGCFPGNIIPAARLSPAFQKLVKTSPPPGADGYIYYPLIDNQDDRDVIVRGDYRVNDKHSLVLRYLYAQNDLPKPTLPGILVSARKGGQSGATSSTIGDTYIASPRLIAETHLAYVRIVGHRLGQTPYDITDFGVKVNEQPLPWGEPSTEIDVLMTGKGGFAVGSTGRPGIFTRENYELNHSWRYQLGRHNLTWGADISKSRYDEFLAFKTGGEYTFDGSVSGYDAADAVLGQLYQMWQNGGEVENRRSLYYAVYGGDSFRVTRRLTVNLGIRWEPWKLLNDIFGKTAAFDPTAYSKGVRSTKYPNAPAGLFYPGDVLNGAKLHDDATTHGRHYKIFSPRIGLAWDVLGNGKLSVRSSYGLFYDTPGMWMLNAMSNQAPFGTQVQFRNSMVEIPFDDPYRYVPSYNIFPVPSGTNKNAVFLPGSLMMTTQPWWNPVYTQTWNFVIDREVVRDLVLRLGYVGTKVTHLNTVRDLNAPVYDYSKTLAQNRSTTQQRRPRPEFSNLNVFTTGDNSSYNAFQMSLNKRFSRGFSILNSYTWSKHIDDNVSFNINVEQMIAPDPYHLKSRGPADDDHRHRWVSSFVWQAPNMKRLTDNRALAMMLGHWQLGGILTLQSGMPFTIQSSTDTLASEPSSGPASRADQIGKIQLSSDRTRGEKIAQYYDRTAAKDAAPGTIGNMGRNVMFGPGYANVNVSVTRGFPLPKREGARVEFRFEAFNLLNSPHLGQPEARLGRSNTATISSTSSDARILQFALKLAF